MSGYRTIVRNPDVLEPDNFRKRRNPDVQFSDVDCTFNILFGSLSSLQGPIMPLLMLAGFVIFILFNSLFSDLDQ